MAPPFSFWNFVTDGLGGAFVGLARLCELQGEDELARRAWPIVLAGVGVSRLLLISDLGRAARFRTCCARSRAPRQ
jgi:hypothetical protein